MSILRGLTILCVLALVAEAVGERAGDWLSGVIADQWGSNPGQQLLPTQPPNAAWEIGVGNLALAAGVLAALTLLRIPWRDAGLRSRGTRFALAFAAPVVGLNLVAWASPAGGALQLPSAGTLLGYLLLATCIALGEELFYRGALLQVLEPARHPTRAVVISVLVFGLFHVIEDGRLSIDLPSVLNALTVTLAVAVPFALIRLRGGSLWGLVVCHALYDTFALIVTDGFSGQSVNVPAAVLSLLVAGTTCALYVWWFRSTGGYAACASTES